MITAKQAREIAGPTLEESINAHLDELEVKIKAASERKRREIILRSSPYSKWAYKQEGSEIGKAVIAELKKIGFEVHTYYKETQFVDIGLVIKW